jgi:hypothetical protein
VDKGVHAGGAFSATIPLVALYYRGFLDLEVSDPVKGKQVNYRYQGNEI